MFKSVSDVENMNKEQKSFIFLLSGTQCMLL